MKNLHNLFSLCVLAACLVMSCGKNYNNSPAPATPTYASIDEVFSNLAVQPKIVTVDAGTANTFYGNSGTRYIFPANCFQTASGASVTGSVQLSSAEYAEKGDMIFSKMLPISDNEPLLSGGEIDLSASQNGQKLFMKPGMRLQANMPIAASAVPVTGFVFFSGVANSNNNQAKVNWVPANPHGGPSVSMVTGDTLGIVSDSLRVCNADAFMHPIPNYQTFTVAINVINGTLPASTQVFAYALYDTYKGVWPLGFVGSYANGVFTERHTPNIFIHFVAFALINGKFYGGINSLTPVTSGRYTIDIAEVDATAFKAQVNKL